MHFDPISGRKNFTTTHDPDYLSLQFEELHASEHGGFSSEIECEIRKIEWCDLMIWQFPLWWFGLPASLKGWVDRVFAKGRAYGGSQRYESGVFRGKRALLSLTTGGPDVAYREGGRNGDMNGILRPIQRGILQFTGFEVLAPQIVFEPARLTEDQRKSALAAWARRLQTIAREAPVDVGTY
jgi:NAD(P)H dehydrogenase (quinone)